MAKIPQGVLNPEKNIIMIKKLSYETFLKAC